VSERQETTIRTYETSVHHIGALADFQATHGYAMGLFQSVILAKKPFCGGRQRYIQHCEKKLFGRFEGRVGLVKIKAKTTEVELIGETFTEWILSGG
jgi:hypothetical protein